MHKAEFGNHLSPIRDRESVWNVSFFFSKVATMSTCLATRRSMSRGGRGRCAVYCASGLSRHSIAHRVTCTSVSRWRCARVSIVATRPLASGIERVCVRERAEQDFRTATKVVCAFCSLSMESPLSRRASILCPSYVRYNTRRVILRDHANTPYRWEV